MSLEKEKVIMRDSDEAATYRTGIEGWVSSNGRFYGKGEDAERMARHDGSTHFKCECGGVAKKGWSKCDSCIRKGRVERYDKLPFAEYDGSPVFSWDGDEFFYSEEDIMYLQKMGIFLPN